jgi:plastocyanin domain-containing protein
MEIKVSTLRNLGLAALVIIVALLFGGIAWFNRPSNIASTEVSSVVSMQGDTQIITMNAKGGYSPRFITARAGVPTILRVVTKNTFDCSTALVINQLKVSKNLPPNGNTDIPIMAQTAGAEISGTCSMGMYSFRLTFI